MDNNLTDEQKQALALDKNISVTAGAGSGKTKILTDRFLKIAIQNPQRVKNILAITFTNKAAGEMMERIASEVEKRLQQEKDDSQKLKLYQIREQLNSTYISTIHTFCSKILREFPIEAGIQPDFKVTEEINTVIYKSKSVKYAFDFLNNMEKGSDYGNWTQLFTTVELRNIKELLNTALSNPYEMGKISSLYERFNLQAYTQFIEKHWLERAAKCASNENADQIFNVVDTILSLDKQKDKSAKALSLSEMLTTFWKSYQNAPYSVTMYSELFVLVEAMTTNKGKAYNNLAKLGSKASWSDIITNNLIELSALCAPLAENLKKYNPGLLLKEADERWFAAFKTFLRLYNIALEKFKEIKKEQNVLDYEDLQILTMRLLQNNDDVYEKLRKRFDFIMVDEFQDTNPLQWDIISLLARNQDNKLFVVGDPKQSIYGFRNADIRIFNNVREKFAADYGKADDYQGNVIFRESFRFLPRLNEFINYLFSGILQESDDNPYEVGYHPLRPRRNLAESGWVELALIDTDDETQSEEEYIARRIEKLINEKKSCYIYEENAEREKEIKYGHIAILIRSRNNLLKLEETLRRFNIPFKTLGGIGFWERQEIFDFYYLLRFLSNPADDLALIAVLRSKFLMAADSALFSLAMEDGALYLDKLNSGLKKGHYDADEKKVLENAAQLINKWLALKERVALADLLKTIIDDTFLKTVLLSGLNGEQLAANVDKLIDLADAFDAGGLGGLQDFLSNIHELINRETKEGDAGVDIEDDETVKIMTIHASKGLQFPVVFLPYLNPQKGGNTGGILIDPDLGLSSAIRNTEKDASEAHTLLQLLKALTTDKESAEKKRLFYVAVTRASNYLFMSAKYKEEKINDNSPLEWIARRIDISEEGILKFPEFEICIVHGYYQAVRDFKESGDYHIIRTLTETVDNYKGDKNNIPQHLLPLKVPQPSQTFSATKIMTYLQNKEEYYRRYHLGFFESDYETFAKDVYESDHHLLRGSIVHKFLELKENYDHDEELLDKILADFDIFDTELTKELKKDVRRLYEKISDSPLGRKIMQPKEYRNEAVITARIGNDYFTGAIDRLILNDDNIWEVVDYKTNKIKENELDKEGRKYEWQIKSYALFVSRLFPEQSEYPISFYFLEIDRIYRRNFDKGQIFQIEKEFKDIINSIKNDFPLA